MSDTVEKKQIHDTKKSKRIKDFKPETLKTTMTLMTPKDDLAAATTHLSSRKRWDNVEAS